MQLSVLLSVHVCAYVLDARASVCLRPCVCGVCVRYSRRARYATESSNEHDMLKNYVLGRKLGVGASGVVRLAVHRDSHARKAVKIIHRGDVTDMSRLDTEIKAMLLLRHPRVVQLDEVLEDPERIYFVMELCGGGSLADIVAEKPLDERLARFYFAELVEGVAYCHAQGVCHRDLKLENLLCDNLGHLKITDFGHAGIFQKGWDIFQTGLVGTLWHLAPEQIAGQAYSGERVDVWAMGVALCVTATQRRTHTRTHTVPSY